LPLLRLVSAPPSCARCRRASRVLVAFSRRRRAHPPCGRGYLYFLCLCCSLALVICSGFWPEGGYRQYELVVCSRTRSECEPRFCVSQEFVLQKVKPTETRPRSPLAWHTGFVAPLNAHFGILALWASKILPRAPPLVPVSLPNILRNLLATFSRPGAFLAS
jgi:hypothetical protein